MSKHKHKIYFLSVLLTVLILSACNTDLTTLFPDLNLTAFTVRLTDNPTDLEEVNIDLELVVIKGEGPWDTLEMQTYSGIYNLLDYQNGLDTVIGRVLTTFDYIKEIRLILGDENSVVAGGETFDLKIPSGSQSGLKIKTCIDLRDVDEYELIIDFDAHASIHQTGNGLYILRPVIRPMNPDAQCGDDEDDDDHEGDDEIVDFDDLPDVITDYIRSEYRNFNQPEVVKSVLCDGTEVYYIKGKAGNERVFFAFELDGDLRQTGEAIDEEDLPDPVSEAIAASAYAEYELEAAYSIKTEAEEDLYRVELELEDDQVVLIYKSDGALECEL